MDDPGEAVIPFGKYAGQTIEDIASDDAGLCYLDWLRGESWFEKFSDLKEAIDEYFDDATNEAALDEAIRSRSRKRR